MLFRPLDPGSVIRIEKESRSEINLPDHTSDSLVTIFWVENA